MYQVSCPHRYYIWDFRDLRYIEQFESVDELIEFIACGYREVPVYDRDFTRTGVTVTNIFIDRCACSINEGENRRYFIFDNRNRILNVHAYEDRALVLYKKKVFEGEFNWITHHNFYTKLNGYPSRHSLWKAWDKNTPEFRRGPVPHTGKWKGGPWQSCPHTFQIKKMYANPEFKGYNRISNKTFF